MFGSCEKGLTSGHEGARCPKPAEFQCSHRTSRPDRKKATQYEQHLCRDHTELYAANAGIPIPEPPPEPGDEEIVMPTVAAFTSERPRLRRHRLPVQKRKETRICIRLLREDVKALEFEAEAVDRKLSDYMRHLILTHPLRKAARGGR